MKKIIFLITISFLASSFTLANTNSNTSLKNYLDKKDIENTTTQIYLLNRCSAIYAYASGIILKTEQQIRRFSRSIIRQQEGKNRSSRFSSDSFKLNNFVHLLKDSNSKIELKNN